ncbi:hypothetical protein V2J09_018513 [Rumex salicifolius]
MTFYIRHKELYNIICDAGAFSQINRFIEAMESESSSNLHAETVKPSSELESLVKEHEEKLRRIQQLKKQIQETRQQLQNDDVSQERMEAFKVLTAEYNYLRQDYNKFLSAGKPPELS